MKKAKKKTAKKRTRKLLRETRRGRFTTKKDVRDHPETTVTETVK